MYSKDAEDVIADLTEFLRSGHPSLALQFFTSAMVRWTHSENRRQSGKFDSKLAWQNYLNLLRKSLDGRLSLISSQSHSSARKKRSIISIPPKAFEYKGREILALLESMPPDDAIGFMVELTTNWCFSIPSNFLPLVPVTFRDTSDEAIANGIYEWLVGYHDLILWS